MAKDGVVPATHVYMEGVTVENYGVRVGAGVCVCVCVCDCVQRKLTGTQEMHLPFAIPFSRAFFEQLVYRGSNIML